MKRKIASLLSLTMILSSIAGSTVFAEELPGAIGGTDGINGSSSVNSIDTVKYRVILPTNAALNYIADPQGLAQLGTSGSETVSTISGDAGKVYSNGDVVIANRSSKDIKVTASVKATDQTAGTGESAVKMKNALTTDWGTATPEPEIMLAVVADEAEFAVDVSGETYKKNAVGDSADNDAKKYTATTTTASTASKTGYQIKQATAGTGDFVAAVPVLLKKADYVAKASTTGTTTSYDYDVDGDSIGGAVSFSIAGKCSKDDTWAKEGSKMKAPVVNVTYTFANASDTEITSLGDDKVKVVTTGLTEMSGVQTAPLILATAADVAVGSDKVSVKLLGAADNANTAVKTNESKITSVKVDNTTKAATTGYTVTDAGVIEISGALAAGEHTIEIVYGSTKYKNTVTVNKALNTIAATTTELTAKVVASGFDADKLTSVTLGTQALTKDADTNGYTLADDGTITVTKAFTADSTVALTVVYNSETYSGTATVVSTAPTGEKLSNGSITITAADNYEFDSTYLKTNQPSGDDKDALAWSNKPVLNGDKNVWTIPAVQIQYLKVTDGSYTFKVKYKDSDDVIVVLVDSQ